jgi:hypothetical protein
MPSLIADLVSGFDTRRRAYGEEELKRQQAVADREFNILSVLAQHPDPEIASIGATGLLEVAGGARPGKGLKGFLGEVDRSTYMPQIQQWLKGPPGAPAQPGSAVLPGSSPVQPERQAAGPPSMAVPPMGGTASAPPGMEAVGTGAMDAAMGQGLEQAMGAAPPGMAGDGPPVLPSQPIVPMPETPQAKYRRLFPTAGEIAADTQYQTLRGKMLAIAEAIRQAGGSQEDLINATMGAAGAPRRATRSTLVEAEYRTMDGQELRGTVIFDPDTREAQVDGQPVTILRQFPKNPPRPIRQSMATGTPGNQTRQDVYFDPTDLGTPLAIMDTGIPVAAPPAPTTGGMEPVMVDGTRKFAQRRRDGTLEIVEGVEPPPPAGGNTPEMAEAIGLLVAVQQEVQAREAKQRVPGLPAKKLDLGTVDQIVLQLSKGRWKSLADLKSATVRVAPTSGTTARDKADRVRDRLNQQRGNAVPGSGMPPGPPPGP